MTILNPLGPVAGEFYLDNSEVACIMGPVGSGKTNAACLRIGRHVFEEHAKPDANGVTVWRCEACKATMRCEQGHTPGPHSVASLFRIG